MGKSHNVEGDYGLSKSDHIKFYLTLTIRVGFEISRKIFFRHFLFEPWGKKGPLQKRKETGG